MDGVDTTRDPWRAAPTGGTVVGKRAIEEPDPSALAAFYSRLLGWNFAHEEQGTAKLATPRD